MSIKTNINFFSILVIVLLSAVFIIVSSNSINSYLFEEEALNQEVGRQEEVVHNTEFIVMFKDTVPNLYLYQEYVKKQFKHFPVVYFHFTDKNEVKAFINEFHGSIRNIEPLTTSNSHSLPKKEMTYKTSTTDQSPRDTIHATDLHQLGYTGEGVKIGIIDTGISDHADEFGTRIKGRKVFVNQTNGYSHDIVIDKDSWGHGTHVAGLAAGSTTGIAPKAELYSAKIIHTTDVKGAGNGGGEETTLGMLAAIEYLVEEDVDIINISLGQYHNLVDGLREEIINYVTIRQNILFCISAGNSGTNHGDRGSLNNPTPALQGISVAASNIQGTHLASFSSKGPKIDYSLKPDLTAPGLDILGPSNTGTGYVSKSGTSMASPIAAGAAALLIDYLKKSNLAYTPGTVKSALLLSARDMKFPVWSQGAGFLNVSAALNLLNSSTKVQNSPDLVYLHPKSLPIDPYKILFPGSKVEFNLTVITSVAKNLSISISEELSRLIEIPKNQYFTNNSILIPITFEIPRTFNAQIINSHLIVGNNNLLVQLEIRNPVAHILFEESFNQIVKHGFSTAFEEMMGDTSNTIGMYSSFTQYLAYEKNYSITPHVKGPLTLDYLRNYSAVILANPFSLASDVYMDWVANPGGSYMSIPPKSIKALYDYIDTGGSLLIASTTQNYCNISAINQFLDYFDLKILDTGTYSIVESLITNPQDWTTNIPSFPFRGNYIQSSGFQTTEIAFYNDNPTLASYTNDRGGKVLLFSSDLIFDNIGLSSYAYFGDTIQNKFLAYNAIAYLTQGTYERISTTIDIPYHQITFLLTLILIAYFVVFFYKVLKN